MAARGCLLLVVCVFYSLTFASAGEVVITGQPKSDKPCYTIGDEGTLNVTYTVTDETTPLDRFRVEWNAYPNKTGRTYINGKTVLVYEGADDRIEHDARWMLKTTFNDRSVTLEVKVTDLQKTDETELLFAFIVDTISGNVVASSNEGARFFVNEECPTGLEYFDENGELVEDGMGTPLPRGPPPTKSLNPNDPIMKMPLTQPPPPDAATQHVEATTPDVKASVPQDVATQDDVEQSQPQDDATQPDLLAPPHDDVVQQPDVTPPLPQDADTGLDAEQLPIDEAATQPENVLPQEAATQPENMLPQDAATEPDFKSPPQDVAEEPNIVPPLEQVAVEQPEATQVPQDGATTMPPQHEATTEPDIATTTQEATTEPDSTTIPQEENIEPDTATAPQDETNIEPDTATSQQPTTEPDIAMVQDEATDEPDIVTPQQPITEPDTATVQDEGTTEPDIATPQQQTTEPDTATVPPQDAATQAGVAQPQDAATAQPVMPPQQSEDAATQPEDTTMLPKETASQCDSTTATNPTVEDLPSPQLDATTQSDHSESPQVAATQPNHSSTSDTMSEVINKFYTFIS